MPPKVAEKRFVDEVESGLDHVDEIPKGSENVNNDKETYFFPVFKPYGLKFTDLKKPKTYSTGALAKE